ncbi:Glutathione-specific gamma-glutamylcyclotransferase [Aphelenchoides besseyi]|nr:Glutathione-specific gamma-glutamylcyclotransferase [Aphelenchoides besseyi]
MTENAKRPHSTSERRPPFDSSHKLPSSLDKFHLLIGVTGSVATIKIYDLIAEFQKKDVNKQMVIKVVATTSSLHFFDAERLEADGVTVYEDRDEWNVYKVRGDPVLHIELRRWADAFLLAPLDANTMAKIANGICDNLLTCIARAWDFADGRKHLYFAPAMNTAMWEHPITAEHMKRLKMIMLCKEIPPIEKELICGDKGYGAMATIQMIVSIVYSAWKQNFKFCEVKKGVVRDYARRFFQLSPDHRGTVDSPGRVVTLVPEAGSEVFGLAFRIPDDQVEATIEYLNRREQAGYERVQVDFHPSDGSQSFPLDVYVSVNDPENIYYDETATIEEIAETIYSSRGISGNNIEYALRIAHIHRVLAPSIHDHHLFEIEKQLLKLCEVRKIDETIMQLVSHKPSFLNGA